MTIAQGRPYDFCTASSTLSDLCDRGATAEDAVDGILNNVIRFCGFPMYQDKTAATTRPIMPPPITVACGIDTQVPGSYPINFTVMNGARRMTTTVRTLVVQAVCRSGEHVCTDLVGGCGAGWARDGSDLYAVRVGVVRHVLDRSQQNI